MIKKIKESPLSRYGIVWIAVLLFAVFSATCGSTFCNLQNVSVFMVGRVAVGFFALAALVPMIAGEFDISLGYMLGTSIMLGAKVGTMTDSPVIVLLVTFLAGLGLGCINGLLTVIFGISSTISTLGSGMFFYGVSLCLNNCKSIMGVLPREVTIIFKTKFAGFNFTVWILMITAAALWYLMEHTPFGKNMYAAGMSERVAYLAGIQTKFIRFMSFAIAGGIIGIGAVMVLGQSGNAYPETGPTYLMPGLATVFLSIASHKVGRYNVPGAMAALIMLAIAFNGLGIMGTPFWFEGVANGVILLGVVLLNGAESRQALTG